MPRPDLIDHLIRALEEATGSPPSSPELVAATPDARARELTTAAASRAAATAGALALPPGPLGLLTILPDLVAVWHIQRQLVADIAACYGRSADLHREAMLYCMFRHASAMVARDLLVRMGERWLLRRAPMRAMERSLQRVGLVVSQRALGRGVSRWLPLVGAAAVGAYAFYDTQQVGRTAQTLFEGEGDVHLEPRTAGQTPDASRLY